MIFFNPIHDGPFCGYSRMGGGLKRPPLPKISHTYSTMMKLGTVIPYLRRSKKYMNHLSHPLTSADISIFDRKPANFELPFLRDSLGSSSIIWDWHVVQTWNFTPVRQKS